jgi:hypothetical protein
LQSLITLEVLGVWHFIAGPFVFIYAAIVSYGINRHPEKVILILAITYLLVIA